MIQLRKSDGSVAPLPPGVTFIELVNDVDKTIGTVFLQSRPGVIMQITPGTKESFRYEEMFKSNGVKFGRHLMHRDLRS